MGVWHARFSEQTVERELSYSQNRFQTIQMCVFEHTPEQQAGMQAGRQAGRQAGSPPARPPARLTREEEMARVCPYY